jgi:hypothetical protein
MNSLGSDNDPDYSSDSTIEEEPPLLPVLQPQPDRQSRPGNRIGGTSHHRVRGHEERDQVNQFYELTDFPYYVCQYLVTNNWYIDLQNGQPMFFHKVKKEIFSFNSGQEIWDDLVARGEHLKAYADIGKLIKFLLKTHWKRGRAKLGTWIYIRPGRTKRDGVEGIDWYHEEDLISGLEKSGDLNSILTKIEAEEPVRQCCDDLPGEEVLTAANFLVKEHGWLRRSRYRCGCPRFFRPVFGKMVTRATGTQGLDWFDSWSELTEYLTSSGELERVTQAIARK